LKERIRFVCKPYIDSEGKFRWPANEPDRDALASRLLGACIVAGMDEWIERATKRLERGPGLVLTPGQKDAVERLLAETVCGVVFSVLVKLDQFPQAAIDLILTDPDDGSQLASIMEGDIFDLHDRLWGWLSEFSEYAAQFGTVRQA
jgi:hypothetical protein